MVSSFYAHRAAAAGYHVEQRLQSSAAGGERQRVSSYSAPRGAAVEQRVSSYFAPRGAAYPQEQSNRSATCVMDRREEIGGQLFALARNPASQRAYLESLRLPQNEFDCWIEHLSMFQQQQRE